MKIKNIARLGGDMTGCDCEEILQRLTDLEENQCEQCCDCEAIENSLTELRNDVTTIQNNITTIQNEITHINEEIIRLDRATEISTIRRVSRTEQGNAMQGITTAVLSIGPTYNYWGEGTLDASHGSWGQGTYYLARTSLGEFPELLLYQGDPTIGTAWFATGGQDTPTATPVFADASGIYIQPRGLNPNSGTYFKFTLTLILVES
ncbi:MAG: hypothetical protein FWE22_05330 [Firmicutes bacterium]|nr:hypothetical protein [Bacillota bacterium]